MRITQFFQQLWQGLNPLRLHETEDCKTSSAFGFFFTLLLFGLLVLTLAAIPLLLSAPAAFSQAIGSFGSLSFQPNVSQLSPVSFPYSSPLIIVDTLSPVSGHRDGLGPQLIIGSGEVGIKGIATAVIDLSLFKDLKAHQQEAATALTLLAVLLLPSLLIIVYVYWAFAYLLLILLICSLAWANLKMVRKPLPFRQLFLMALFSSSWIVLLNAIILPLGLRTCYVQYLVWIIVLSIGIWQATRSAGSHGKSTGKGGKGKTRPSKRQQKTIHSRSEMDDDGYIKVGGDDGAAQDQS